MQIKAEKIDGTPPVEFYCLKYIRIRMKGEDPEHSLTVFDTLDLGNPKERRLAVYALNDYYGGVFAENKDSLDFWQRDLEMGIKHQWKKTKSRLDALDDIEIPGEYNTAIESVNEIRNNVSHDFTETPPRDILEKSRELAPEWREWINEVSEEYERHQESLTATEALVQVGKRRLEYIEDSPQNYSFGLDRRQESLNDDVSELRQDLEELSDEETVSRGLVETIADVMDLERDKDSLENEHGLREEEARREEEIRQAENTRRVIVTESVNEFGEIVVVTHEVGQPDETYVLDINHPDTPKDVRERLADLEPNEEVQLRIEEDMIRDKNGRIKTESYVAEIR